jgi:hypothetical protein
MGAVSLIYVFQSKPNQLHLPILLHESIGVIACSNFEAGVNINGRIIGVIDFHPRTDVVNASTGVNVVVVTLSGEEV